MCCGVGHGATDDCQTRLFLDLFKCLSDHLAPLLNTSQQVDCLSVPAQVHILSLASRALVVTTAGLFGCSSRHTGLGVLRSHPWAARAHAPLSGKLSSPHLGF